MPPRHTLLAAFTVAALACRNDFPPEWKVSGLRVLAVTLDPPRIGPGETTHVRVVAVDTQSRPLSVRWSACPPTAGMVAATNFHCASPLAAQGDTDQFDLMAPRIPGAFSTIPVAIRVEVCAGGALTIDANGDGQCAGSDARVATRTLAISATEHNQNPGVDSVLFDMTPWPADGTLTVPACTTARGHCDHPLRVVLGAGARESYLSGGADGGVTLAERITTHFYVTDGTLEGGERADPTETATSDMELKWTAPAAAHTVDFWFVVDDGRGGVTELTRRLTVTP